MADSTSNRSNVFISYSHRDKDYLDRLHVFLKPWLQDKHIEVWDDTRLKPGDHWEEAIARALASARVAVLLVSPDFLASDFITQNELPPLLDAAERAGAVILPVILMPCLFRRTKLSRFQTVNDPAKPLSLMPSSERDVIWERLVEQMLDALAPAPAESAQPPAQPAPNDAPEAPKEPAPAPRPRKKAEQKATPPGSDLPKLPTEVKVSPIGTLLLTYRIHINDVNTVAWSPDGTRIASGSKDQTVQIWDATTGEHLRTYFRHTKEVRSVAWSPDGTRIVSSSGGYFASGSDRIQIWNAATGQHIRTCNGQSGIIWVVAWSPDGTRIVSASSDNSVMMWYAAGNPLFTIKEFTRPVASVAWSPDGKLIATGCEAEAQYQGAGKVQVWETKVGKLLYTYKPHSKFIWSVAWSPDGNYIASASGDGSVVVTATTTGKRIFTYGGQRLLGVRSVAWSPDGTRIAFGGEGNIVQIWNALTSKLLFAYRGHSGGIRAVAWSPDGTRIASASADNTVQVWSAG
ncbi:MAG TPA: TIR domain-containing protein [Ktedonobacterales bacterium]